MRDRIQHTQYSDDSFKPDIPHNGRSVIDVTHNRYEAKKQPLPSMPGAKKPAARNTRKR